MGGKGRDVELALREGGKVCICLCVCVCVWVCVLQSVCMSVNSFVGIFVYVYIRMSVWVYLSVILCAFALCAPTNSLLFFVFWFMCSFFISCVCILSNFDYSSKHCVFMQSTKSHVLSCVTLIPESLHSTLLHKKKANRVPSCQRWATLNWVAFMMHSFQLHLNNASRR